MVKCRRMKRQRCVSKNWIFLDYESPRKHASSICRLESFTMKTDILMSGSTVKNHISFKTGFGYSATRRTSFRSWFLVCQQVRPPVLISQLQGHFQDRRVNVPATPGFQNSTALDLSRQTTGFSPVLSSTFELDTGTGGESISFRSSLSRVSLSLDAVVVGEEDELEVDVG